MMQQKNRVIEELLIKVRLDEEILAVILFGSAAAGESTKESDVDVCLVLDTSTRDKKNLSEKRIEYMKDFDLDVQVFQQLPLYIRQRVLKNGQVLFCRNEEGLYEIAFVTIRDYASFEHIYRYYLNEVARA